MAGHAAGRPHEVPAEATAEGQRGGPEWLDDRPEVVDPRQDAAAPTIPGTEITGANEVKALPAKASGFDPARSREDTSKRSATSTEFVNPDGSRTMRVYAGTRFLPATGGRLQPADTTLRRGTDGKLRPRLGSGVELAARGTDPALMSLDVGGGQRVSLGLVGANDVPSESTDVATQKTGNGKATFKNIRAHSDVELTAALWGVKEDIVLRSASAPTVWEFTVNATGGLRAELDAVTRAVVFKNAKGETKAVIPAGFMVDSKIDPRSGEGARSNGVAYELLDNGRRLRITLDAAWIKDGARQFPIYVDPTLRSGPDGDDTYVMSNANPYPSLYETELKAGTWNGGGNIAASFIHYNLAFSNLRNHQILGASLSVHEIYSYCCPPQARPLYLYRVTQPWGAEVDRWPGPAFDGAALSEINASYGTTPAWLTLPIPADRMTRWVHGLETFHGFRLGASYTDSYGWKRFSSAQSPQPNNVPFMDVHYSVQGATYGFAAGGFTTPVTSVSDGVLPINATNWGVSTWNPAPAGGTSEFVLRQSIYNSAGQEMISGMGGSALATYSQFNVPTATGPHGTVRIDVKVPKLPPGSYRTVLGMTRAGALCSNNCNYDPFGEVPRFEGSFTVPNTPPTITAHHPANNATVDTLRPALWVNATDPDNWPAGAARRYWFEACAGTPAAPVGCVNSGWQDRPNWTVPSTGPAGPYTWSKAAFWHVKLSDTNAESAKLGPFWLTPVVPQPEVTSRLVGTSDGGDLPGINPQAGNFGSKVVDVTVSVPGPPLTISRTYNSQDPRANGAFGAGWTTALDQHVAEDGNGTGNVVATLATGLQLRFGRNPDGTFAPPPGVNLTLVRTATEWVLRDNTGTRRTFDLTGRLTKIVDASGNTQSYLYQGTSSQVDKVKDDITGRQLHLTWAGGHVTSVSTDAPAAGAQPSTWTYSYDGDRLTRVCAPLQADSCADYGYTESAHYRSAVLDDNPSAYWTLGEATDPTATNLAARTSGENNASYRDVTRALQGAVAGSTDFAGGFDSAAGGGAGSALVAPNDLLSKDMAYAVELWFKADPGKNGVLATVQNKDFGTAPTAYVPWLYVDTAGKLRGNAWSTTGGVQMVSPARVDNGQWHHAVLSTAVDTHTLYLDGVQVAQTTGRLVDHLDMNRVVIGNGLARTWPDAPTTNFPFTGAIDEVAVYRHPLGAGKVAAHHRLRAATSRLSTVTEPGGFVAASVSYDGQGGRVTGFTDRHGAAWTVGASVVGQNTRSVTLGSSVRSDVTYTYDTANGGRIAERRDQFGSTRWNYNAAGFVHETIDASGWTTYTDTDARGNVVRTARWVGRWSYRGYGYYLNAADPLDPRNDTLTWQTNGFGWGNEAAYRTSFEVDTAGRTTKITYPKPAGVATNPFETYRYTTAGSHTAVDGGTVPAGKLIGHTDQRGGITSYHYYKSGDLGSVVDPAGLRHEHGYDALGRVVARAASMNVGGTWTSLGTTNFVYNRLSKPERVTEPAIANPVTGVSHRKVTSYVYDRAGRTVEETVSDATGGDQARTTWYGYDNSGRLTSTTAPDSTVTRQEWDAAGDRVRTTDAGGRVLEHRYDDRHQLVETVATGAGVDPLAPESTRLVVESRAYDPLGRLATIVDAQGRERSFTYHGNGPLNSERVVKRNGSGAVTEQYSLASRTYDGAGNVATFTTSAGRTTSFVYDDAGLLQAEVLDGTGLRRARTYARDSGGNIVSDLAHTGVAFASVTPHDTYIDPAAPNTSQVDGAGARYADNDRSWVYKFDLPQRSASLSGNARTYTGAKVSLRVSNQFLIEASANGTSWTELGRETAPVTDHSNLGERTYDLIPYLSGSNPLRVRVRDSQPANGWGGRVLSVRLELTDSSAPSNPTTIEYDAAGRPIKETTGSAVTRWTRDPRGLVTSATDPAGATTDIAYDAAGRPVSQTAPAVDTWVAGVRTPGVRPQSVSGHNTFGDLTEHRDPTGAVSRTEFDAMGRPVRTVAPGYTPPGGLPITATTTARYDERGLPVEATDPRGGVSAVEYDWFGRPVRRTAPDPDGDGPQAAPVTRYGYDRVGQLLRTTDPTGAVAEATYDVIGAQVTSTVTERVGGETVYFTTSLDRNPAGELIASRTPSGLSTSYAHNTAGQVEQLTPPDGTVQRTQFDHAGRPLDQLVGQSGTSLRYDAAGRLVRETDHTGPAGQFSAPLRSRTFGYDAAGRRTQETSGHGRVVRWGYDAAGRTTSVSQLVDPANQASAVTVALGYDAAGRRTRMVDGNGNATDYTYNSWGLVESVVEPTTPSHTAPTNRTWTTSYDVAGQPVKESLPGGVRIDRTFDGLGRMTEQHGAGTAATTESKRLGYDALGRITRISGPGGDTTYTWNDRSLLTGSAGDAGDSSFGYDGDGRLTGRTDRAGSMSFGYNSLGQLANLADPLTGRTQSFGYDSSGRLSTVDYGAAGARRTLQYDELNRVSTDTLARSDGTATASTSYGYDADNLVTRKTTTGTAGSGLNSYAYDGLGRITSWNAPGGEQTTYGWDAASNRTTVTTPQGTRTSTYDARNRLMSASGGAEPAITYDYTARGTLERAESTAGTVVHQFDAFERMVRATKGGQTVEYRYDALDRLARRGAAPLHYVGLGNDPVALPSGSGETLVARSSSGMPVSDRTAGGTARSLLTDLIHGDVVAAFDPATASPAASTQFAPFGQIESAAGDASAAGYQGGYTDPLTGQVNAHARWYDPSAGTFTSRDTWTLDPSPVAAANRYGYGNGSPLTYSDPSGHIIWAVVGVVAVAAIMAAVSSNSQSQQKIDTNPTPRYISPCSYTRCGSNSSKADQDYRQGERDFANNQGNTSQGTPNPGTKGTGTKGTGTGKNTGTGCCGSGTRYTPPPPPPPPIAVVNNNNPTPRPSTHQTLGGSNRPQPGQPLPGTPVVVPGTGGPTTVDYEVVEADGDESSECGLRCQIAGGLAAIGNAGFDAVIGIGGLGVDLAQCTVIWVAIDSQPCEENVTAVQAVLDYAINDPVGFAKGVFEAATKEIRDAWNSGNYGGAVGLALFEVGDLLLGSHGAGKARKLDDLPSCPGNSFTPETEVVMADGTRQPISEVEVGDVVIATDPATGEQGPREVTATIVGSGVKKLVTITVDVDGAAGAATATLTATDGHPFWVDDQGRWLRAEDLTAGDEVRTTDGRRLPVVGVSTAERVQTVHNLTVRGIHTYYVGVGPADVLVHNNSCGEYANTYGGDDGGVLATLDDGVLSLAIETGPTTPRGGDMFADVMNHFGVENVTAVQGKWVPSMPDNLNSFNKLVADGLTPEQAAAQTFTGKMAARYGYTNVEVTKSVGTPGHYTNVEVRFSR